MHVALVDLRATVLKEYADFLDSMALSSAAETRRKESADAASAANRIPKQLRTVSYDDVYLDVEMVAPKRYTE